MRRVSWRGRRNGSGNDGNMYYVTLCMIGGAFDF